MLCREPEGRYLGRGPVWVCGGIVLVKTRQYCYFKVECPTLSTGDLTVRLGMEPDEVPARTRRSARAVARNGAEWRIVRASDESVDDQIQHLVDRLDPIRAELVSLCAEDDVHSVMQVVRYFHDPDGVQAAPGGTAWTEARHWPRPLGWNLSVPVLDFLSSARTALDVDEDLLSGGLPGREVQHERENDRRQAPQRTRHQHSTIAEQQRIRSSQGQHPRVVFPAPAQAARDNELDTQRLAPGADIIGGDRRPDPRRGGPAARRRSVE
ncbi:DUF4279 domain-containing protein [Nocardia xishanensis]|uniref:DUF4279 domain-containing protein n=1 Tax=Nocardia xishanensis TaxID=238964 RepID=UPI0033FA7D0F